jgi:hypothetical protein
MRGPETEQALFQALTLKNKFCITEVIRKKIYTIGKKKQQNLQGFYR